MDKVKTCNYCSNSRTYEMTEEDECDLNFCYNDENDLSARNIFLSEDKQFDIMVVSGAGEPQRLEFRHWNKDAQRWFVYNTIYLKRCINCGREITEYPEFIEKKDKEILELKEELSVYRDFGNMLSKEDVDNAIKIADLYNRYSLLQKFNQDLIKGKYILQQQLKELPKKIIKEVEDTFTQYLPLKNRTGAWLYGRLNEIKKEFEDE